MSNLGIATDVNNQNFSGAMHNPDDLLSVEFYWDSPIDKWETEKTGKQVRLPKAPYIRYSRPGDRTTTMEMAVEDYHKRRFSKQWMAWQIQEGLLEGDADIPGWKIDEWAELDHAQKEELRYLRYQTVEQIAGANDTQVQRMGMGGLALREKAKRALINRTNQVAAQEIEARDKIIAAQGEKIDELSNKFEMLMQKLMPQDAPQESEELEGLRRAYEKKFGERPHHRKTAETLKQEIGA